MRGYILVQFNPETDLLMVHRAMNRPGVKSVDLIMGPHDAILTCEASDFSQLGELAKAIRGCPGIRDSITCPVV